MPITIEDILFINQRRRQRKKGCFGSGEIGHFVEDCPNKPKPKDKKEREGKDKWLTTMKMWDDSSSDETHPKSCHHRKASSSSSHTCLMAKGKIENESDSDVIDNPSYDDLANIVE